MNVESFQKKLGEIMKLAKYNNNILNYDIAVHFFEEDHLNEDQTASILAYLRSQGVHIKNGLGDDGTKADGPVPFVTKKTPDPLTQEEEDYLKDYLEEIRGGFESEEQEKRLLRSALEGDDEAKKRLIEAYVPDVISSVRKFHRKEFFAGDMLQEGNLGLIMALEDIADHKDTNLRAWIMGSIDQAILTAIQAQEQQKWEDDALVGRVEKLELAVKQLTDESEEKFSVEELSALLDMSVDEIEDVLRLTGDDK